MAVGKRVRTLVDEIDDDDSTERTTPAGAEGTVAAKSMYTIAVVFDNGACLHYTDQQANECLKIVEAPTLKKFRVTLTRYRFLNIYVDAINGLEAANKAEDLSGNLDFNDGSKSDGDIEVGNVEEVDENHNPVS